MPAYPLGRVTPPYDPRDALFPMAMGLATLPASATVFTSRYWYPGAVYMNQGSLGACVGFTGANWLQNSPTRTKVTNNTGFDLYAACKAIDGYPGEGTWDRVLMDVLKSQGRIERYLWAQSRQELKDWVLYVGPVMVGTEWTERMFDPEPDEDGDLYLIPTGNVVGGHEYLIRGYSRPRDAYRMRNSWGRNWGLNGEAWIRSSDLYSLVFDRNGDACAAVEKKV